MWPLATDIAVQGNVGSWEENGSHVANRQALAGCARSVFRRRATRRFRPGLTLNSNHDGLYRRRSHTHRPNAWNALLPMSIKIRCVVFVLAVMFVVSFVRTRYPLPRRARLRERHSGA